MRHPGVEPLAMRPQGQREGNYDSDRFQTRTLRYSLRRVSPLDSIDCRSHNPKVGGSNPASESSWQAVDMPTIPLASCNFLAAQRDPTLTAAGRGQGPGARIFQPTTQPTKDDVLYDLRVFWQSPRSCKLL